MLSVVWQLGVLTLLGYGMDPMSILVPFLVFAIAVSHGVQMVSSVRSDIFLGASSMDAARGSFRRLLVPGGIALATDTLGFFTILFIQIRVIQEIAIAASIGVAAIVLIDLVLLPVLLSHFPFAPGYRDKLEHRARHLRRLWTGLSAATERRPASAIVAISILLAVFGWWKGQQVQIGDLHRGVPELHADSRYNRDTAVITSKFSIGVDILSVIAETKPEGCVDHAVMTTIDEFSWHMENLPGVHSTIDLPRVAKQLNAGWNEGSPKWRVLSRNQSVLTQAVTYVPTTTGLLNSDCSVMPVMLFTEDHKAATIERIVREVKGFEARHGNPDVSFKLATGNVGVMAATNEAVAAAQWPIMACVFGATILLCLASFRSWRGTLAIVLPLGLVSLLSYALMAMLDIGLKVSTLPVAALGVGIGVDYGIYLYGRFRGFRAGGAQPPAGLCRGPRDDRQRRALHRAEPDDRRVHLGAFAAEVPGGHGRAAGVPVLHEHDRRAGAAAGTAPLPVGRDRPVQLEIRRLTMRNPRVLPWRPPWRCCDSSRALAAAPGAGPGRSPTRSAAAKGAVVYVRYCVSCHGKDARGDGPLAADLRVPVPDMTTLAARNGGRFPEERVRRIIESRRGPARARHARHAGLGRRLQEDRGHRRAHAGRGDSQPDPVPLVAPATREVGAVTAR